MNCTVHRQRLPGLTILLALSIFTAGCTTVVRENIISSVNTGIGVSLAENPKTELYEVKVGYIRSQFYSVPTGKTVEGASSNAADVTPELVSGIRMNSDARHLFLGITVAENFAVGEKAVMSPAAVAMYVSQAGNAQIADAASRAAIMNAAASTKSIATVNSADAQAVISKVRDKYTANPAKQADIERIVKANGYASWNDFLQTNTHKPENLVKILTLVESL